MKNLHGNWINLSNKKFEASQFDRQSNSCVTMQTLKPGTGIWFSRPSNGKFFSEWGNFINDKEPLINQVQDENGYTNIIEGTLKDTAFVINYLEYKDLIDNILQTTNYDLPSTEKRKILLEKVHSIFPDKHIEYLLILISSRNIKELSEAYYHQKGDFVKKKDIGRRFRGLESKFFSVFRKKCNSNYENAKLYMQEIVSLLIKIQHREKLNREELKTLEEFFQSYLISDIILDKCFNLSDNNKADQITEDKILLSTEEIVQYLMISDGESLIDEVQSLNLTLSYDEFINSLKPRYYFDLESLEKYKSILDKSNDIDSYKANLIDYSQSTSDNLESEWLIDYFSGCVNLSFITDYDLDESLGIFDTNCLNIEREQILQVFPRVTKKSLNPITDNKNTSSLPIGTIINKIGKDVLFTEDGQVARTTASKMIDQLTEQLKIYE